MNGYFSPSVGLLLSGSTHSDAQIRCVDEELDYPREQLLNFASLVDDWEEVDSLGDPSVLQNAALKYHLARGISYSFGLLDGIDDGDLEHDLLEYIEDTLQTRVPMQALLQELLVAPLHTPETAEKIAATALGHGYATTANLFEKLFDLQPLLRRLVGAWLEIPASQWMEVESDRTRVWNAACSSGVVVKTLEQASARQIRSQWNVLILNGDLATTPTTRASLGKIFHELSERLFPSAGSALESLLVHDANEEVHEVAPVLKPKSEASYADYQRVIRQINAIIEKVSVADERRATIFFNELVDDQLSYEGGAEHAVKSLCNLAKQCADLYRTDWERVCLNRAHEIDARDTRTLCQYADHLKRVGQFDSANDFYEKARLEGEGFHAVLGMADVIAAQGDFDGSIKKYKTLANWEDDVIVRTAIADNLRRLGKLDEAANLYENLASEGTQLERATAGLADIARRRGDLSTAESLYRDILQRQDLDQRSKMIYRLALCDITKRCGDLSEAYRIADQLVKDFPFLMHARIQRGTILGMLDRYDEAFEDIPGETAPAAFGEWIREYYGGILLLKLGRYDDAKRRLVDGLKLALGQGNDRTIMRLGAAVALLAGGDHSDAECELNEIRDFGDSHSRHLAQVLRLHLAVARNDQKKAEEIAIFFRSHVGLEPAFISVVDALLRNDLIEAQRGELNLLLAASPDSVSIAA